MKFAKKTTVLGFDINQSRANELNTGHDSTLEVDDENLTSVLLTNQKLVNKQYENLGSLLNEKSRRLWCAAEAKVLGRGGIAIVSKATKLLITADGVGSNGSRNRLWRREIQKLSNFIGIEIHICHFPPATSKWNKIEHRLFSYISQNWRGKPLISYEIIVNLIASTRTTKGLEVSCGMDTNNYETGIKVSDAEMKQINIERAEFHGEWNYNIKPN